MGKFHKQATTALLSFMHLVESAHPEMAGAHSRRALDADSFWHTQVLPTVRTPTFLATPNSPRHVLPSCVALVCSQCYIRSACQHTSKADLGHLLST